MNLTPAQIIALSISTLSVLGGATAQLTTLFGQAVANDITTTCALLAAILGGWIAVLTGQASIVKQVAAMPGVDKITVNTQANQTLATLAVSNDASAAKVEASPAAEAAVTKTASAV